MKKLLLLMVLILSLVKCVEDPASINVEHTGIMGIVKSSEGEPLSGVKVSSSGVSVTTKNDGKYFLELQPGERTIKLEKENFVTTEFLITIPNGTIIKKNIDFQMLGSIKGIVIGKDGNPIAGVKVTTTPQTKEVFTDSSGNYLFSYLQAGNYQLTFEKPNYAKITTALDVVNDNITERNITLQMLGSIQGVVTGSDGNPVSGVKVTTTPPTKEVYTDDNGNYLLSYLQAGNYQLSFEKNSYINCVQSIQVENNVIKTVDMRLIKFFEMVFIQGGTFEMGSNDGDSNEQPIHTVTLDDFYIGKFEITQAEYELVMNNNPSYFSGDEKPVEQVSWFDAITFCNKLSEIEGLQKFYNINGTDVTMNWEANGYRLPTEAEWEYACKGGMHSASYKYSGSNNIDDVAWYDRNSGDETHPIGTKQPNELGIYDMSGNVWEWCNDWYGENYYSNSPQNNPKGPSSGSNRVQRGGSFYRNANYCRSANRHHDNPAYTFYFMGFRISRTAR